MRKLTFICCTIALLLALPVPARCVRSPFCRLGSKAVDLMNGILFSPGKIPPVVVTETIAFAEECPSDLVPAFREFADNEQELHRSWLEVLKAEAVRPDNADLRGLLWLTEQKLNRGGNDATDAYFDGVFSILGKAPMGYPIPIDRIFESVSLAALRQFPHVDGAGGFDVSDFLLFLLGTHPVPFLKAVGEDQPDTSIWLAQLGSMSFTGLPANRERREAIRSLLLRTVSSVEVPELAPEKYQIESALGKVHFRGYH